MADKNNVNKVAAQVAASADEAVRMDAWRSILERTDRIISGRPVTVKIVPESEVPHGMDEVAGWSDGEAIHFNGPMLRKMLAAKDALAAVLRLKGLNYHELSHVLYTPRMQDELPKRVIERATNSGDRDWWYAFNALEDQRIETWFTATYSPSRRYFEAMSLEWLVRDGNAEAAILLHGRKYLPARIRVQAGRVFAKKHGQDLLNEFKAVIDEYVKVEIPRESIKALTLVSRYHALLKLLQQSANGTSLPKMPIEDNGAHCAGTPQHGDQGVQRAGRVLVKAVREGQAAAKKEAEAADKADKAAAEEIAKEQAEAAADAAAEAGSESGSEGKDGQGEGAGESGSEGQGASSTPQIGETTREETGGYGSGGLGTGGGHGKAEIDDSDVSLKDVIADMIDEAEVGLDDIAEDTKLAEDAQAVLDAVKAVVNNGKMNAKGVAAKVSGSPAPDSANAAVRRVVTVLSKIRSEVEPNIERRVYAGRVDVRRYLTRKPQEVDVFTTYDEGAEESTGMEVVLLMDMSGSMSNQMFEASQAIWVLKRAFDRLGVRTTAMAYDTDHEVLFQPSEKANGTIPVLRARGGTDPTSALEQAQIIFAKSHQPNKVLISVTDGSWGGDDKRRQALMRAMHRRGVVSMLLTLNMAHGGYKPPSHGHMVRHDLSSVSEMPKAALKIVTQIMRKATGV